MGNFQSSTSANEKNDTSDELEHDLNHLAKLKRAEDARKDAIAANKHDNVKENHQILKKLFKRMDPTVSQVDSDIQGELQVSVKYDAVNSKLLVNVIKCRNLGINNISGRTAEPFVELRLFPDLNNAGVKQTSVSSKSQNPTFNEKFAFHVDEVGIADTKLILKVLDHDIGTDDELEFIGEVIISLSDFNFIESSVHTAWYTLQPETDLSITGELEISLGYTLPHTLSVTIHQATNLKLNPHRNSCDPVVKVGIPGIEKIEITQVKLNEPNPAWEETFSFDVPQEEFGSRYIVMTVIDSSYPDCLLGHVVVDLDNFNPDYGFRGSFPLTDMSHSDRLHNEWFQTTQVQEFREALWAHSVFNYPGMIFQHHSGKKVIRLTCQSAGGTKARIRLNNGIPVA